MHAITIKYHSDHRKHRYELLDEPKNNLIEIFIRVLMDCRTTSARKFRTKLGLKQYDAILTKEQSILTKIMSLFKGENMETIYFRL